MESISKGPAHQAYLLLRIAFAVVPIVAGVDKFFDVLDDWDKYLGPWFGSYGHMLARVAGVVEVIAGLGVIFRPRIFANIVGLWLALIILNLLAQGNFYDDALRDFGLCLSAFALGRLAKAYA